MKQIQTDLWTWALIDWSSWACQVKTVSNTYIMLHWITYKCENYFVILSLGFAENWLVKYIKRKLFEFEKDHWKLF